MDKYPGFTKQRREQMDEEGYILIEDALEPFGLDNVVEAWERIQAEDEPGWKQAVRDGTVSGGYGNGPNAHTMSAVYKRDKIFFDIGGNPMMRPLVEDLHGVDVQCAGVTNHCHHAGTAAHTTWHRDWSPWTHHTWIIKSKIFYFLDDQDLEMGCFSIVPGTHKLPDGPDKEAYSNENLEKMPGMKKITGKAGSAILWNVLMYHTGTANTSNKDRRIIITSYIPFWMKTWGASGPPQNVIDWTDTPDLRQFWGIHAVDGRASYDRADVPYLPEHEEITKAKKF
jgi:ectoine hydroxylase-related dioxygenase (phytanoyl-CoA dioxygenase family)